MANVLVTGGAGFIGSHLVTRLVEAGHRVRVLDDLSSGKRSNLAHVDGRFEFLQGDLRSEVDCSAACRDVEFILHEAAIPSVPKSVEHPQASHDVNVNGTFNLLRTAAACKVRRVIYAASSSAYGDTRESPKHEGIRPEPLSPYAVQKLLGEHYLRAFYECYGLESLSLRYFNVFGARQDPMSQYAAAIPAFVTAILGDEPPVVYGDGEQTRDFTYIDNVVEANLLAMKAPQTRGESVNIACGGAISVNEVIAAINRVLGRNVRPKYVPARAGDVKHSCADIRLAGRLLGFQPVVAFEDGLRRAIEYYRAGATGGPGR
ncbi:MAG: SDR family oxidoreductase [Planctomycetes bacterium]|nr:SDR family oxidoreductase [Planctomycetota bacterium]